MYSTTQLIEKCLGNDAIAQKYFYDRYSKRLFGIIIKYFDNIEDSEDVLIETIHIIFTKMGQYKGGDEERVFCGWIKRIAVNQALHKIRHDKVHCKEEKMSENYVFPYKDDILEDKYNTEYLLMLIKNLTPQLRTVFNLYAIEGYSHKEIGEMMGISEGTSKAHLSRAREKLQQKLILNKEKEYDEVENY